MDQAGLLAFNLPPDHRWGEPPAIAVVYAVGICAMDEGIKARSLSRILQGVVDDRRVKAIVLRVDSPGGDAMASDYVAEVMRKAKGKKPFVVSQGAVAASGGYWLSMYADTIVAGPSTITGSIGVIAGWLYNKGLKERLGMSTDHVKAGEHADLGFGFRLPLVGVGLPDRAMMAEERARAEQAIRSLYADFVGHVAKGREKTPEAVDSVGQGRVWSGADALDLGLVDMIGGLETAIAVARARAGIRPDEEVRLLELPEPGLFSVPLLLGGVGIDVPNDKDSFIEAIRFLASHNGVPLPIMSLENLDAEALGDKGAR
jgi:protease-4